MIDRDEDFPMAGTPDIVSEVQDISYEVASLAQRLNDITLFPDVGPDLEYALDNVVSQLEGLTYDLENVAQEAEEQYDNYLDAVAAEEED